jgi:hypothetical protein
VPLPLQQKPGLGQRFVLRPQLLVADVQLLQRGAELFQRFVEEALRFGVAPLGEGA